MGKSGWRFCGGKKVLKWYLLDFGHSWENGKKGAEPPDFSKEFYVKINKH
jgi:hypothetical protein